MTKIPTPGYVASTDAACSHAGQSDVAQVDALGTFWNSRASVSPTTAAEIAAASAIGVVLVCLGVVVVGLNIEWLSLMLHSTAGH
jgi:hypothetical protein